MKEVVESATIEELVAKLNAIAGGNRLKPARAA